MAQKVKSRNILSPWSCGGFTLIELLVVITIIGLLASIVLVSLSETKNKGKFAAVQANLNTVKSEAELYYAGNNSYGTQMAENNPNASDCSGPRVFGISVVTAAISSATANGAAGAINNRRCIIGGPNGQTWAVSIPLASGIGSWCVGTGGIAILGTASGGGPNTPAICAP